MSVSVVPLHKELLAEISLHSKSSPVAGYKKELLDDIFSLELPKEELIERISWLSDSFYPGALQRVISICTKLFSEHIETMSSYFDKNYHLNVCGIQQIVGEIAKKKGVEFPIYSFSKESLDDFYRSELPYAGFVYVDSYVHYSPIFIEKNLTLGKYNIVITDSVGFFEVLEPVTANVNVSLMDSIYVSSTIRQYDSDSCGIFVIRDFSKWIDHIKSEELLSKKLSSFVRSQNLDYSLVKVLILGGLPEEFLRSAQSLALTSFCKDKTSLEKFTYMKDEGYRINCKIERYHVKCLLRILKKIF